jgi:hypothetical protein
MKLNVKFRILFLSLLLLLQRASFAQLTDSVYADYIATPQLYQYGNQLELPIINVNTKDRVQLEFDDLENRYKNYYYTYVLCDYNWMPVDISPFMYTKGFTQNRINTYRFSSIAFTRYVHYQAFLPEQNSYPTKSGNYIVKVFLDGDTSKLVFTKRLLVVDNKAEVGAAVTQLLGAANFTTHQKVRFSINTGQLDAFSAQQQIKVVVLQNNRWDNMQKDITPTFVRGNILDYSSENVAVFAAGKEWRWLDLRSFRLQSDRVKSANYGKTYTDIFLRTDETRNGQRYVYYGDYNGQFMSITYESINPFWQADYAKVNFSFKSPNGLPYEKASVYLSSDFTGYALSDKYKLKFNEATGLYECAVFMKQGYYFYNYTLVHDDGTIEPNELEGNYWETENSYTILVYYRSFTDRADQLIAVGRTNSQNSRPGFSF